MPLKPITLHGVKDKDLGEIVRIGRREARRVLKVPFVHIASITQNCEVEEDSIIIHVKEDERR